MSEEATRPDENVEAPAEVDAEELDSSEDEDEDEE